MRITYAWLLLPLIVGLAACNRGGTDPADSELGGGDGDAPVPVGRGESATARALTDGGNAMGTPTTVTPAITGMSDANAATGSGGRTAMAGGAGTTGRGGASGMAGGSGTTGTGATTPSGGTAGTRSGSGGQSGASQTTSRTN